MKYTFIHQSLNIKATLKLQAFKIYRKKNSTKAQTVVSNSLVKGYINKG